MENSIINELKAKNQELVDIVIQKVLKEYKYDVDLIGICGSFFTGDFYDKSDLDLLVVLNNERGCGFSKCFILNDVGYDFYGSRWDKLEKMASFDDNMVSHVIDVDIVYCRTAECKERFMKLRKKALNIINNPMTLEILQKARKYLDDATLTYGKMIGEQEIGVVRQLSGIMINYLNTTVCFLNHNYFKRGVKRQLEEILTMKRVPQYFERYFRGVIHARTVVEIKETSTELIRTVKKLYDEIAEETLVKSLPTKDTLKGTYEEIWSNWKNKIHNAVKHNDIFLAFSSGIACQEFYDEMHREIGTSNINLMKHFRANNLNSFADEFEKAMQLYKEEYNRLHMQVQKYDSIDEFRKDYLG